MTILDNEVLAEVPAEGLHFWVKGQGLARKSHLPSTSLTVLLPQLGKWGPRRAAAQDEGKKHKAWGQRSHAPSGQKKPRPLMALRSQWGLAWTPPQTWRYTWNTNPQSIQACFVMCRRTQFWYTPVTRVCPVSPRCSCVHLSPTKHILTLYNPWFTIFSQMMCITTDSV